jgi:predicted enzyme related to lactoylglutathione lyase
MWDGARMNDAQLLNGVDFIAFPTKDWEAAKKFYGETLGLPFGKQWGEMPAGEFETGTVTIALMQVDAFGIEFSPNSTPFEFHVEDFDAAKAELESRGVNFVTDVIDSGVCKQAIFQDPDGNALGIHHRYAEGIAPQEAMDAAAETAAEAAGAA